MMDLRRQLAAQRQQQQGAGEAERVRWAAERERMQGEMRRLLEANSALEVRATAQGG